MFKHILAPVDGSECSKAALDDALKLSKDLHAGVTVCYVSDDLRAASMMVAASGEIIEQWFDLLRKEGQAILRDALSQAKELGVSADAWLLHGPPSDAIALFAGDCGADLIIMGSHGRTGVKRLFIGSVAEGVIRIAPVPVLVVREPLAKPPSEIEITAKEQVYLEPAEETAGAPQ
ncbi:MAG: universal stress protein [Vulcanimicrobiaceae bacterium]